MSYQTKMQTPTIYSSKAVYFKPVRFSNGVNLHVKNLFIWTRSSDLMQSKKSSCLHTYEAVSVRM